MIPRLIHQIWHPFSAPDMPRDWHRFSRSWKRNHPEHRHILWGIDESRRFVETHYPDFLPVYDGYQEPIKRVDSLRILLLDHFGGVYVDLDVECLRSVEELVSGQRVVFPAEPAIHSHLWRHKGYKQVLSTAFMASEPGHPLWKSVIAELKASAQIEDVMDATGPFVLTRCYERYAERNQITVAAPETIYPVSEPQCRDLTAYDLEYWIRTTNKSYGIHHWASTWNRPGASHRPARRPYHHGLPHKLKHPVLHRTQLGQMLTDGPLVSCIMVTRGWVNPARWSIECFLNQTYGNRELVVLTTNEDGDLADYIQSLNDPRIRFVGVFPRGISLGAQRNLAVGEARGEFICTWDDDDLFGADRITAGITAITTSGSAAAFLERICIWWPARQQVVISARHHWENTMIARRSALPPYPELDRSEDSEAVAQLVLANPISIIDDPNLFVYVVWGNNTWGPEHFQKFFQRATFSALGRDYDRALSVLQKHVPILEYLEWLQQKDPKTFDPWPDSPAQLDAVGANDTPGTTRPVVRHGDRIVPHRMTDPMRRPAGTASLRFLFAWELGGGLGHTVPLSLIARPLLDAGHEVHLVLFDLSTARAALGRLAAHPKLHLWQAPYWPSPLYGSPEPACYAELLFRAGYLDPRRLTGLVDGWDTLFDQIRPDFLLADHAPTALLAARGRRFKKGQVGTGFFLPFPEKPMPSFREWEPIPWGRLERSETTVLNTCNAILAARSQPSLEQLSDLLECDETFLLTVPELDHFERRARDPKLQYYGVLPTASHGYAAHWPAGTEPALFVYLKSEYVKLRDVIKTLKASPWRILAYIPGLTATTVGDLSTPKMRIVTDPVDMTEVCFSADAVLCQAGSGTVSTVLHAGKPVVMLPMHMEQLLFARRVQSLGAGLLLLEDRITHLDQCLHRVLSDASFLEAARAFARRYSRPEGNRVAETVAARCEELAAQHRIGATRSGTAKNAKPRTKSKQPV
jgi:hypothetical protein